MPADLDPIIAQKLDAFGRRWRRLVLLRGVCEGVVTLLAAMTLVALVDWMFILPDAVRVALSAAGYLATAAVVGWNCVRPLRRAPGQRELARLLEKTRPELREDLVSAVELGEARTEAQWDSEQFRQLLQASVAERMRDLQIDRLLPNRLISRWLSLAVIGVTFCGFLALIPGLGYEQLMARALAPLANVDRVSSVKIELLEPAPADLLAPRGDTIPVTVRISGREPSKVLLEVLGAGKGGAKERVMMGLVSERTYSGAFPANADTLQYRIRAGDAITRKFTVQTRPRPHVVAFDKTYNFPPYTRLPAQQVREESGDLTALEGSQVELTLQVNQPVRAAELRLEQGGGQTRIPLQAVGTNQLRAQVPLHKAGTYNVHLVSAETGFENKFSPQYELRPVPDLVPRVSIDAPQKDMVVSADEVIALHGSANDDLALNKVAQLIRINEGAWTEVPLSEEVRPATSVARKWDILPLKANPGDRVTTKLVATDLKGNRGESNPLHLLISSPGFDVKRLQALEVKRQLHDALTELNQAASEMKRLLSQDAGKNFSKADELHRKQTAMSALSAAEEIERHLERAESSIQRALPLSTAGREASDLALVGRLLSELKHAAMPQAKDEAEKLAQGVQSAAAPADARNVISASNRLASLANNLEQNYLDLLGAEETTAAMGNLNYLAREQQRMSDRAAANPNEPETWEYLARRQAAAAKETEVVEEMLQATALRLPRSQADRTKKTQQNLQASRKALEQSLTNAPSARTLAQPTAAMQKGVDGAVASFQPLEREMAQRADKARERLEKMVQPEHVKLDQLRRDVEELAATERKIAEAQERKQRTDRFEAKAKELQEKTAAEWKATTEQLKDRATIEERRPDADPHFVSDATRAAQALSAVRAASEGKPQSAIQPLQQIQEAMRTLEAGHALAETHSALRQLANAERWEQRSVDTDSGRPRDWNWIHDQLRELPKETKSARLPEAVAQNMSAAAQSAATREVDQEMAQRQKPRSSPLSAADQLDALSSDVKQAQHAAEPALADARSVLAESAPRMSEMMAGLARASAQMEQNTRQAAQNLEAPETAPAADSPPKLLAKQTDLNAQIDDLKAALRREANVQDLGRPEGRERSRDADDAVAMLREPPPKAEDALQEAMISRDNETRQRAMESAAGQQRKLADTLDQLARHYQNLEAGAGADTRAQLRMTEEELGIKSALDAEYNKAQTIAEMAQQTPEELLRTLEQELGRNQVMRQELNEIADYGLDAAKRNLERAASQEREIAGTLGDLTQTESRQNAMLDQARKLAEEARRLAMQAVPAIRMDATTAQAGADSELKRAGEALERTAKTAPTTPSSAQVLAQKMGELVQPLEQAKNDLSQAAEKAGQTLEKTPPADSKAAAALSARNQATKAAEQTGELAQQAKRMAEDLASMAKSGESQMNAAAARQGPIASNVDQAGGDIARAGRHNSRLGTPQGEALQQVGQQTQTIAAQDVPAAQRALSDQAGPAQAQAAVDSARAAMENQISALQSALQMAGAPPVPAPAEESSGTPPPSPTESKMMARTLDRLDAAMNQSQQGQQGQQNQPGQPGEAGDSDSSAQSAAQQAMADAAKAQSASMMAARRDGQTPGQKPDSEGDGSGAPMMADGEEPGILPQIGRLRAGEWGKLPPKLAQGLMEAQREQMSGEYRAMVETYFRVIAERGQEKRP